MTMFADTLINKARVLGPLCVGIDPHPGRVPQLFGGDTPDGLAAWGIAIAETAADRVAAVKPQVGLFERHGPDGMAALVKVCAAARAVGMLVLMDAKRGDIGSTAEGYAAAYLGENAPFECDALTVNPYMGIDTLQPYVREAEANGKGVIVLTRTSNPGSADFQSKDMGGAPLYARVVEALAPLVEQLKGKSGWSSLMMVTGATGPDEARAIRNMTPNALFLVPGYGVQGAGAADAMAGFVPGKPGQLGENGLEGGLVNASRSVTFPTEAQSADTRGAWDKAIAEAIDAAQTDLKNAGQALRLT